MKLRPWAIFIFFVLITANSQAAFVTPQLLESLPSTGRHSCYFANFNGGQPDQASVCSATVISRTQVVLEDSACWRNVHPRRPKTQLVCNGGQFSFSFEGRPTAKPMNGLIVAELDQALPYSGPIINSDRAKRERLMDQGQCHLKAFGVEGKLGTDFIKTSDNKIRHQRQAFNPRFAGGHLLCQEDGQEIILAIIGEQGTLHFLDEKSQVLESIDSRPHHTEELSLEQRADLICRETQECLQQVSPAAIDLSTNMISIINVLHQDLKASSSQSQNKEREDALRELINIWREILIKCQDAIWKNRRSNDTSASSGYFSGLSGTFERLSISVAEVFSDDFLLNQFKGVELFSENLTDDEMKRTISSLSIQMNGLNNIQRIALGAKTLAHEVVKKFLLELNPEMTLAEQNLWISENAKDFETCLNDVKNSNMVKECGDKFGLTVPALIAKTELERQTQNNFLSLYRNADGVVEQQKFQRLKNEVTLNYQRCINGYYYKNQSAAAPERARACVYEGLLAGYHYTAREQIQENFQKAMGTETVSESMVQSALSVAQECDYGPLFHRSGRMSESDYHTLSKLSASDFQNKLEECSQSLTEKVGGLVILQTVLNNPEVQENYDSDGALTLSQNVIDQYYRPCMQQQRSHGQNPNPRRCESMITQLTTLQVAKKMMAPALRSQLQAMSSLSAQNMESHNATILAEVEAKIETCHNQIKDEYLALLQKDDESELPNISKRTLLCVNEGVKIMSSKLTTLKIHETFENDPSLSPYRQQVINRPDILALADKTAQCFSQEIEKLSSVNELGGHLDKISTHCALETEKDATLIAMQLILDERLKTNIADPLERADFISRAMQGDDGLRQLILNAQDGLALKSAVASIPKRVTLRFASSSIPITTQQHLAGKVSPARIQTISQSIISKMENCLKDVEAPSDHQLSRCINQASSFGHQEILKEIVTHTAKENLQGQELLAQELANDSAQRLQTCLAPISLDLKNADYDKEIEKCMVTEISLISRDIPREAILGMAPLLSQNYNAVQLRTHLLKVDQFYLQQGNLDGVDERDPAVIVYMSLNSCLVRARVDLRSKGTNISDAQKEYETCTSEVEGLIKNTIRRNFVNKDYEGKTREHLGVLDTAASILIELTGKQAPRAPGAKQQDPSDISKTQELLDIVGQSTILACNYDKRGCEQALDQTKRQVLEYKRRNPEATSKELEQLFINSPFIDLIIEANVSQAMSTQLSANLTEFADQGGILEAKIKDITSPEVLRPIMQNRYGQAAKALVRQSIIDGAPTEDVVNNPSLKAALGLALTQNIEVNSFTDQLLHGLVQPILNEQKRTSNNPTGIFTNTKVTFGRFFGVVKGADFDWQRIRTTSQGQEARRIFAHEILQPVLEGRDIARVPAGSNNRKSQQDEAMERIQKLIEDGIKDLSR